MADKLLTKDDLVFECPECGKKTKKRLAWVEAHSHFTCADCGTDLRFDKGKFASLLEQARDAADHVRKSVRKA